ncbi:hypothetical protein KY345_04335 [Candidatus Woesearchaeota archaeon]|nr:hypothetical protein [Candidatus Woesearchaeota archaeon]
MPFDPNLDQKLWSETADFEATRITVSIMSYNEGEKKIQISRENFNQTRNDYSFAKLGRMTKEEAEAVVPLLQKALENM